MPVETPPKAATRAVTPFEIEADHPRNSDLLIQGIPNCRLRSAIDGTKSIVDKRGDIRVPLDQARHLSSFPRSPGMRLWVNPDELSYKIYDPLNDDPQMCERIARYLRDNTANANTRSVKGVETVEGKLDFHRMKSVCREMFWLCQAKEAKLTKGKLPTMEELEEMPGYFLLNPGSRVPNTQPRYEHQMDEWVTKLSQSGA